MSGFRHVREAVNAGDPELMTANMASFANRLFVKYHDPIPPVEVSLPELMCPHLLIQLLIWQIEICIAGEEGPRNLNPQTVMAVQNLPCESSRCWSCTRAHSIQSSP